MFPTTTESAAINPTTESAEPTVTITAWRDQLIERHPDSIGTYSEDMLIFWTPILGPTATLMAHQLARLVRNGAPHTFSRVDLGRTFGLGSKSGRLDAALGRLDRFGVAQVDPSHVAVRLAIGPMTVRHLQRLPEYLALAHQHRS